MAKRVRATKEERRATLDSRHKYLVVRLVDAGTLVEAEVEDALVSDDKVASRSGSLSSKSELSFPELSPSQGSACGSIMSDSSSSV